MSRQQRLVTILVVLALAFAACGSPAAPSTPASGEPTAAASASPGPSASVPVEPSSVAPSATPDLPTPTPPATPTPPPTPPPTPTPTPTETMIVRAYLFLDDRGGGDPALVPVLRTVPKSAATAGAAMTALLAGPIAKERSATPRLTTTIPTGTTVLGIRIASGTATVDLSSEFFTAGGTAMAGRLAQVVYTLTQFSTVDRVRFEMNGEPAAVYRSEGVLLVQPTTRSAFRDLLPAIFVDRPAWGAAYPGGSHVTGLADVFEAQFRIAIRDADGRVLADRAVTATCGSGCWGTFDITLDYEVGAAQWGTLRAWDISEADGSTIDLRIYPVYLRP